MNETLASFAILSETWIDEWNIDRIKNYMKAGFSIDMVLKNRKKKRGGGVAILWREGKIGFEAHHFKTLDFEVVCAKTMLVVAKKMLYVFSVYYPPDMSVGRVEQTNKLIAKEIEKIKVNNRNAVFIIAGEVNNKD